MQLVSLSIKVITVITNNSNKFVPHKTVTYTDSTKINRPGYNICMYWTNLRQPTAHVKQNIFGKNLT